MMQTSFSSLDGKTTSAAEFIERLFGDLPELFKNEDKLREHWSKPDTRRKLLEGLGEKGYGKSPLSDMAQMVDAENRDLYDVLAYIAFPSPPLSREERVAPHQDHIFSIYRESQQEFLRFVLDLYIQEGVGELGLVMACRNSDISGVPPQLGMRSRWMSTRNRSLERMVNPWLL